jgi:PGF-pre-PGF domain-containing protein
MQNITGKHFDTNYTINAVKTGYATNWNIINLSTNYVLPSNYVSITLSNATPANPTAYFGTNPVDNYNDTDGSVTFDFKCSSNVSISWIRLYTNTTGTWQVNYSNSSYTNNTWLNITITGIPSGNHKWAVWCNDTGANTSTTTNRTFTVDAISPVAMQGTNPIDNYNSSSSIVVFDLKCSDNKGVNTIQLWGNWTGAWHANYTNSSYTNNTWLNITVNNISNGRDYKWAVWCNDTLGNSSWAGNRTFAVDTVAPTTTLISPANDYNSSSRSITFSCSASDNLNLANITLYGNWTGSWIANQTNSSPRNNTATTFTKIINNGRYAWNCRACDNSNNCAFAASNRTFNVSSADTPPNASFGINPVDNYNSTSQSVTFDFKCSDDTGVDTIGVYSNWTGTWGSIYSNGSYTNNTWLNVTLTGGSNGNYAWAVWCNGTSGLTNITQNRSLNINVPSPPSPPSGGGGGGGGGTSQQTGLSYYFSEINPGSSVIINISKDIRLMRIEISVISKANFVTITINNLSGKPSNVSVLANAYKYFEIKHQNIQNVLKIAKIKFKVAKTWISMNSIDSDKVYLYRYTTDWIKLVTIKLNEDVDYVYYEAETPGFSFFAISGESIAQNVCTPSEKKCVGSELQTCNTAGTDWYTMTCDYGCDSSTLTCKISESACTSGSKRCSGNELQQCDGTNWTTVQLCDYGCDNLNIVCIQKSENKSDMIIPIVLVASGIIIIIFVVLMVVIIRSNKQKYVQPTFDMFPDEPVNTQSDQNVIFDKYSSSDIDITSLTPKQQTNRPPVVNSAPVTPRPPKPRDNSVQTSVFVRNQKNQIPVASVAMLTAQPANVRPLESVRFDGSKSSVPGGTVVAYYFDYGNGQNSGWVSDNFIYYAYLQAGFYYAKLKVKDNNGVESAWSANVTINVQSSRPTDLPNNI